MVPFLLSIILNIFSHSSYPWLCPGQNDSTGGATPSGITSLDIAVVVCRRKNLLTLLRTCSKKQMDKIIVNNTLVDGTGMVQLLDFNFLYIIKEENSGTYAAKLGNDKKGLYSIA